MNGKALETRDDIAANYLLQLQDLAREITAATEAIATNKLSNLQSSIAKQEMLCSSLAILGNQVGDGLGTSDALHHHPIDSEIDSKIRAASKAVRELNLQYAALLKYSGKTIDVLLSLCRSRAGHFQEARGPRLKHQTWSCEM
jgi:hypothetical protein